MHPNSTAARLFKQITEINVKIGGTGCRCPTKGHIQPTKQPWPVLFNNALWPWIFLLVYNPCPVAWANPFLCTIQPTTTKVYEAPRNHTDCSSLLPRRRCNSNGTRSISAFSICKFIGNSLRFPVKEFRARIRKIRVPFEDPSMINQIIPGDDLETYFILHSTIHPLSLSPSLYSP